jgi:Leucine Rich repeat
VTTFALNKNAIGPQGCIDIAGALAESRVLTSIELDYNLVGDGGCATMAVMLRENKVLTKMSLNGNGIGLTGAISLAETLRVNGTFRELGLGRNNIGNDGACVEPLNLEGNSISDEDDMAIFKTLTAMPKFRPVYRKALTLCWHRAGC